MKENNAAQAVEQDPINAAILLLTEEADSISDCHTRTLGDWAGEPEAKAHYDHVRSVVDALSQLRAPVADERALDLLDTLFTAYESGTPCYEEPDSQGGYLGMAFRIDDDTFRACADLLNKHRPRAALASAPVPVLKDWRIDTSAGGPILVYKDCSVIESAQAEYVLRLIAADQASAPVAEEAKVQIEYLDMDNHRLRRALQKLMARLTDLLDEDQFANCESIVTAAGVEPPASTPVADLRPHLEWALRRIRTSLDTGDKYEAAQAALDAAKAAPVASAPVAGEAQPVAWFIDWPDEPELGHYIAESAADSGRNRPLVFADASPREITPVPEGPVYAYRRKGLDDFVTCDRKRFDELSAKPRLFETRIFYAAPQASAEQMQAALQKSFDMGKFYGSLPETDAKAVRNAALEEAIQAVSGITTSYAVFTSGNPQYRPESRPASAAIAEAIETLRALKRSQADKDGGQQRAGDGKEPR